LNKYINYLLVVFAFVFPISNGATNIILLLLLILWLLEGGLKEKISFLFKQKIFMILLFIPILFVLSTLFSDSFSNGFMNKADRSIFSIIFSHYVWVLVYMAVFITSGQKRYLNYVLSAFLSAIFFSEIISYMIHFQMLDIDYFKHLHLIYKYTDIHDPTPFMHHIWYSFFLSIAILFLIDIFLHTESKIIKLSTFLFMNSALINLFINGGRTGQIGFIIGSIMYLFYYYKITIRSFIAILGILTIIVTLAYNTSTTFHDRADLAIQDIEYMKKDNFSKSWGMRVASNLTVIQYLMSSPERFIFGAGAGDSEKEYNDYAEKHVPKYISRVIKNLPHLHNQYLQLWFDGTIFALLLLFAYFYFMFKLPVEKRYKPLLFATIAVFIFVLAPNNLIYRPRTYFLFLFITSYFIVASQKGDQDLSTSCIEDSRES